jgi:DNA-binding protein HU-beta
LALSESGFGLFAKCGGTSDTADKVEVAKFYITHVELVNARSPTGIPWLGPHSFTEEFVLNKAELVDVVAKEAGTTKKDAEQVINKMMDTIVKHVASGEKVTLVGFGTFEARQRRARTGRNPKTNEPLHIPAKRVPGFRVGKEFSEAVNKKK